MPTSERNASTAGWRLLVGLGNPGAKYANTRHNLGFEVVDRVLATIRRNAGSASLKEWNQTDSMHWAVADPANPKSRSILIKPQTFMNRSGDAVAEALDMFVGTSLADAMVVLDDLSLPVGGLRVRRRGSDGGHNGLKSIEDVVGDADFPRLRLGIGEPPAAGQAQVDHVLGYFSADETAALEPAIERAVATATAWLEGESLERIMNAANQRPESSSP